jgi:hypothetical protein
MYVRLYVLYLYVQYVCMHVYSCTRRNSSYRKLGRHMVANLSARGQNNPGTFEAAIRKYNQPRKVCHDQVTYKLLLTTTFENILSTRNISYFLNTSVATVPFEQRASQLHLFFSGFEARVNLAAILF